VTHAQFSRLSETEIGDILCWRFGQLVRFGLDLADALELATHVEVDLHAALSLLERGCPPRTALRILT
jgi:hypothetical protein